MPKAAKYLTPQQASKRLGVSVSTLNRYVLEGRIIPVQVTPGGHRRYSRADVERLKRSPWR